MIDVAPVYHQFAEDGKHLRDGIVEIFNEPHTAKAIRLLGVDSLILHLSLYRNSEHNTVFPDLLVHLDEVYDLAEIPGEEGDTILSHPDSLELLSIYVEGLQDALFRYYDTRLGRLEADGRFYEVSDWYDQAALVLLFKEQNSTPSTLY